MLDFQNPDLCKEATLIANKCEEIACSGSPSIWISDKQFADAVTLCAQAFAILMVRMVKRIGLIKAGVAFKALTEMVNHYFQYKAIENKNSINILKGLSKDDMKYYRD